MIKKVLLICLILLLVLCTGCQENLQSDTAKEVEKMDDYLITASGEEKFDSVDGYAVAANGDLHLYMGEQTTVLAINALPDCQILEDEKGRLLILTDPSDKYQHGILGDDFEPTSVTLINLADELSVISSFSAPEDWVIESIRPIWRDWDGDGNREIVLTLSNTKSGAKLALYDENGNLLAESAPIGRGFRWRHALDIAAFGEDGEMLLVDVVTPHIGGIATFYSWNKENNYLMVEATISGFSTHDIGSRAMGMFALLPDESDGQELLIVPSQSKTELVALRFVSSTIQEEWRLQLGGTLTGDIELVELENSWAVRAVVDGIEVEFNIPE